MSQCDDAPYALHDVSDGVSVAVLVRNEIGGPTYEDTLRACVLVDGMRLERVCVSTISIVDTPFSGRLRWGRARILSGFGLARVIAPIRRHT